MTRAHCEEALIAWSGLAVAAVFGIVLSAPERDSDLLDGQPGSRLPIAIAIRSGRRRSDPIRFRPKPRPMANQLPALTSDHGLPSLELRQTVPLQLTSCPSDC